MQSSLADVVLINHTDYVSYNVATCPAGYVIVSGCNDTNSPTYVLPRMVINSRTNGTSCTAYKSYQCDEAYCGYLPNPIFLYCAKVCN